MGENEKKLTKVKMAWRVAKAAEAAFNKRGLDATVSDVLKEGHFSRRSFYEFFGSMKELLVRMCITERRYFRGAPACHRAAAALPEKLASHIGKIVPSTYDMSEPPTVLQLESWFTAMNEPLPGVYHEVYGQRRAS